MTAWVISPSCSTESLSIRGVMVKVLGVLQSPPPPPVKLTEPGDTENPAAQRVVDVTVGVTLTVLPNPGSVLSATV